MMQTQYYTTKNFMEHTGNVVVLTEYRRRLKQAEQTQNPPEEEAPILTLLPPPVPPSARSRRAEKRRRWAMVFDICASMGVVLMTLTFTLRVLIL